MPTKGTIASSSSTSTTGATACAAGAVSPIPSKGTTASAAAAASAASTSSWSSSDCRLSMSDMSSPFADFPACFNEARPSAESNGKAFVAPPPFSSPPAPFVSPPSSCAISFFSFSCCTVISRCKTPSA